ADILWIDYRSGDSPGGHPESGTYKTGLRQPLLVYLLDSTDCRFSVFYFGRFNSGILQREAAGNYLSHPYAFNLLQYDKYCSQCTSLQGKGVQVHCETNDTGPDHYRWTGSRSRLGRWRYLCLADQSGIVGHPDVYHYHPAFSTSSQADHRSSIS